MKIVYADQDDSSLILVFTTPAATGTDYAASAIRNVVGVGKPYYAFGSLPSTIDDSMLTTEFVGAATCSNQAAVNSANINAMLLDPELQNFPNDKVGGG